jgi:putative FmdB family regulatory protein
VPARERSKEDEVPTYEYRCKTCDEQFDVVQSFTDKALTKHKGCGGELRKVFAAPGIAFKGSGFYKNDSRSGSKSSSTSSSESASSTDASGSSDSTTSTDTSSDKKDTASPKKTEKKADKKAAASTS